MSVKISKWIAVIVVSLFLVAAAMSIYWHSKMDLAYSNLLIINDAIGETTDSTRVNARVELIVVLNLASIEAAEKWGAGYLSKFCFENRNCLIGRSRSEARKRAEIHVGAMKKRNYGGTELMGSE